MYGAALCPFFAVSTEMSPLHVVHRMFISIIVYHMNVNASYWPVTWLAVF